MEQVRPDSTMLPAAQMDAEHHHDGTFERDARITRVLTSPAEAHPAHVHPNCVERERANTAAAAEALAITRSPALRAAIEAHREAFTALLFEPDDSDPVTDRHVDLVDAAAASVVATPSTCLADLGAKFAYILHRILPDVNGTDFQANLIGISEDIHRLASVEAYADADPIFAVIEEGRRLMQVPALRLADVGLDPHPDRTAALKATWAHFRGPITTTVPTTAGGCAALAGYMVEYRRFQGVDLGDEMLVILANIARSPMTSHEGGARSAAAVLGDDPGGLGQAILAGWAEWATSQRFIEGDPEQDAIFERHGALRDRLLYAADALPATMENIPAKALAAAWMGWVAHERPDQSRDAYSLDGRFVFDIHAIICGHTPDAAAAADPFLDAVATARAANAAVDAFGRRTAKNKPEGWFQEEEALVAEQTRTQDIALGTVPTTQAGRIALADYMAELMGRYGMADGGPPEDGSSFWALAYHALSAALRAPIRPRVIEKSFAAGHDLSACTLPQLARLYETWSGIHHHIIGAGAIPCFDDDGPSGYTPAGDILDKEYVRASRFLDAIDNEARARRPETDDDRDERLNILVRHELECSGRIADAAVRAELAAAWGA